ncbi:MAG: DoxX family protein [Kofleriaceae bacterium]
MSTNIASTADPARAQVWRASLVVYGLAAAGLGVLCLIAGDLGHVFQPVARWMPLRAWLPYVSGAVLVAGGVALLVPRLTRLAALVLTIHFAVWLLVFNLPNTLGKPAVVGNWEGCGLNAAVVAGGWILLAASRRSSSHAASRLLGASGTRLARWLFAVGLPLIGLAHFLGAEGATVYVPTWLPLRIGWVYLTGAGHVAAGLAILFGVVPRLAAVLEAAQITAFVVLAHLPAVVAAPRDRVQWAMLVYALSIAASAWLVAATLAARPPTSRRGSHPGLGDGARLTQ